MPHADIKYSSDLDINAEEILQTIEETILGKDTAAGACKGRAYPADEFNHTHILVTVAMLQKPHRDRAFTVSLTEELEKAIKAHLHQSCAFSLSVEYNLETYITNQHTV